MDKGNNILDAFKVPLLLTAMEMPHMIEQRAREKEQAERDKLMQQKEVEFKTQFINDLWSW